MSDISKYKMLTDIEQVLLRPTMWIGSNQPETKEFLILEDKVLTYKEIEYVPGLLKIIDEIISNSADEFRRKTSGLNRLHVIVNANGHITVWDNGGITVAHHPEYGMWIPEMLFGNLRSSSNYDDNENRSWVGTNGVGAALTNIFSTEFEVETGIHGNYFKMAWSDNMHQKSEATTDLTGKSKFKGTRIAFSIDLKRFNLTHLSNDFIDVLEKRCIDAAATNAGLEVVFERSDYNVGTEPYKNTYKFNTFREYVNLFGYGASSLIGERNKDWEFFVVPTDGKPLRVGFVNGAQCDKGTHFSHIEFWCHKIMEDFFIKKHKWKELPKREVTNRLSIFINVDVMNPAYDSQTKEKLITRLEQYYPDGHHPDMGHTRFINPYIASELPSMILDWNSARLQAEENKKLRQANKEVAKPVRIHKLIEANSRNREETELWLFEGDSAASGFRAARDPQTQGSYKLRGKVMNTIYMKPTDIMNNVEYKDIVAASGLRFGEPENIANLRYGKFIICTDMDVDGTSIAGLLSTFFSIHFPGLVKAGMIYRAISPLLIASKGKDVRHYYSIDEFRAEEAQLKGYHVRYIKGLAGLENIDYKQMLSKPHLQRLLPDGSWLETIHDWFGGDSSRRKKHLGAVTADIEEVAA